jgi:hypothetical protein
MGKESQTCQIRLYISKKHIDCMNSCSFLRRQTQLDHQIQRLASLPRLPVHQRSVQLAVDRQIGSLVWIPGRQAQRDGVAQSGCPPVTTATRPFKSKKLRFINIIPCRPMRSCRFTLKTERRFARPLNMIVEAPEFVAFIQTGAARIGYPRSQENVRETCDRPCAAQSAT